jgi:mono/diheme cytochrome c family protein
MTSVRLRSSYNALILVATLAMTGCSRMPGHPGPGPEVVRPDEVLDFPTLYKANCAACHGEKGRNGAAISLANPVYLAVAGEENLRQITANGVPGKLMPPFAKSAGGMLTDSQINALTHGMVQEWGKPDILAGQNAPPYRATQTGDAVRGQQTFGAFCARCHGASGEGSAGDNQSGAGKVGSLVDGSYLGLISDQGLRSIIIAGQPDEGMPDWHTDAAQPMTDQQTTDIVAWLASKRSANPGQPYPAKP